MKRPTPPKKFSEQFSKRFGKYPIPRVEPKLLLLAFIVSLIIWGQAKEEKRARDRGEPPSSSGSGTNLP